jgi:hypothetical protein
MLIGQHQRLPGGNLKKAILSYRPFRKLTLNKNMTITTVLFVE